MGSFASFETPDVIGKSYSNRVLLYLESKEDLDILQVRWFNNWGEWITFQAVDLSNGGGGGSAEVRRRVQSDRENNLLAYGIVDRDSLLNNESESSNWQAFFETDPEVFDLSSYFGPYIKVLRRYEMENYLLHPVAMKKHLKDSVFDKKYQPPCSPETTLQCLLDFSDTAILLTAANLVLLKAEQKPLAPLFSISTSGYDELRSCVVEHLNNKTIPSAEAEIDKNILSIRGFLRNTSGEPEEKWNQLNHLIDGKLFLERFTKWFGIEDALRLHLARKIVDDNLIDPEIRDFMAKLKEEALGLV